jgi:hypothetical protein
MGSVVVSTEIAGTEAVGMESIARNSLVERNDAAREAIIPISEPVVGFIAPCLLA